MKLFIPVVSMLCTTIGAGEIVGDRVFTRRVCLGESSLLAAIKLSDVRNSVGEESEDDESLGAPEEKTPVLCFSTL